MSGVFSAPVWVLNLITAKQTENGAESSEVFSGSKVLMHLQISQKDEIISLVLVLCACQGLPGPGNTKLDPCSKPCPQSFGHQRLSLAVFLVLHCWLHLSKCGDPNKNSKL